MTTDQQQGQVISAKDFNIENMVFSDKIYQHDDYGFQKIFPQYIYPDGKVDKMFIQTPELFSFGIKTFENKTKPPNPPQHSTHNFSFIMFDKNKSASEEELLTIKMFEDMLDKIKGHLKDIETIKKLGKMGKRAEWIALVDSLAVLSYQTDKNNGSIIEGVPPSLYVKLQTKFDKSSNPPIVTNFMDSSGEEILPNTLQMAKCKVIGVIALESIYISAKPSVQLKLDECLVTEQFKKISRLHIPSKILASRTVKKIDTISTNDMGNDNSDTEEIPKIVKKIVRKQ